MSHPLAPLGRALNARSVQYVLIGVAGANEYAPTGGTRFVTQDFDLFLPLAADNLVNAWASCDDAQLDLWLTMSHSIDRTTVGSLTVWWSARP